MSIIFPEKKVARNVPQYGECVSCGKPLKKGIFCKGCRADMGGDFPRVSFVKKSHKKSPIPMD